MKKISAAAVAVIAVGGAPPATALNVGIATSNPGSLFHNIATMVVQATNEGRLKSR